MSPAASSARRRSAGNVTELRPEAKSTARTSPLPKDLRTAPAWLSAPAKAEWKRLIPRLDEAFPEKLSALDVGALALLVEHLAIAQGAAQAMRGKGNKPDVLEVDEAHRDRIRKTPASQVMRDHAKAAMELAREYGLTLRAREALGLDGTVPDDDPDDDLFDT